MSTAETDGPDSDGFLARWSRRKAASRATAVPEPPQPLDQQVVEAPEIELPPIETLGADSDYTMFLARGVPRAVQAQALRIAWASDPAIASFRGMAEYAWDFNAPGYGDLAPGDDVAALLSQIIRSSPRLVAAAVIDLDPPAAPMADLVGLAMPAEADLPAQVTPPEPVLAIAAPVAAALATPDLLAAPAAELPLARRRHGGAMPL